MINRTLTAGMLLVCAAVETLGITAIAAPIPLQQTAVVQHGYGGPEVLKLESVPVREPGDGQVLVRVYAASVNPVDWKMREGTASRRPGSSAPAALIPGFDVSGIVAKVGPGVVDLKLGEPVAGSLIGIGSMVGVQGLNGAYSHYALALARQLIAKPKNLTFAQAAGLGVAGGTAVLAIYRLDVHAGQTVLITGVAGGVGGSMAQLAKAKGARVIGTASEHHAAYLKSIGVDEVIDYTQGDWNTKVNNVDIVFDTVGGATAAQSLATLKKGGQFLGINGEGGELSADQCAAAGINCIELRPQRPGDPSDHELLAAIGKLAAVGKFKVHVDKIFPLEQAAAAQQLSKQGHTEGKIILAIVPGAVL